MASRDPYDLVPEMQQHALMLQETLPVLVYCTVRTAEEQARLWRQGRSWWRILKKIEELTDAGYGFLADILYSVGPQHVNLKVTNAVPGDSWHNYGEAFDCAPWVDGKVDWDTHNPVWKQIGEFAHDHKLNWGGNWISFKDYPHIQLRKGDTPIGMFTMDEIRERIKL